jgi:membrane protease YdiL (CAAX protease family)
MGTASKRGRAGGVRTEKLAGWSALVGALALLNYGSRLAAGEPDRNALFHYSLAVGGLILYAIMLAIVLRIARGMPAATLGLRNPPSWLRALGLTLAVLVAILIAEQALEPLLHAGREQGLEPTRWEPRHADAFAANAFVIVVVGPFTEELTFRGLGFALLAPVGSVAAVCITALAFALAHGLVYGLIPLFVFGVGVGFLRLRTGSIYPGMLLHACFNGAVLALAATT